jgi:two-component system sensor histidine kinase DesK
VVELVNDGVDMTSPVAKGSGGMGLRNLRERVEEFGGTLSAGPTDDGSFTIVASVPLPSAGGTVWTTSRTRAVPVAQS